MSLSEFERTYQTVSLELSNPFPVLGQYGLNQMKQFYTVTGKYLKELFSKKEEALQGTLNFRGSAELDRSIATKKVVYSDFRPLVVYVPSVLKPKVYLLVLVRRLHDDLKLAHRIMDNAPQQMIDVLNGYIGNPGCLQDPSALRFKYTETIDQFHRLMGESFKKNESVLTSTGTKSERTFQETYARLEDYKETNRITIEIYHDFQTMQPKVVAMQNEVNRANELINQLLTYVQTKPDVYVISALVADRLTRQMKQLADLTAFVANTLYLSQLTVKSVSDNIYILDRTVAK